MQALLGRIILVGVLITCARADAIDRGARAGAVIKMLREMVNQTKADTLNLPANATSIRENITDSFSCENRTYGYYADVDNDCQIFHVCLTSQGASGRNTTYKWSFICPKETVFNQEVLVCTRSRESIPCEDSPDYYDLNMEIGKIATDNEDEKPDSNQNAPPPNRNAERIPIKNQRNPLNRKKQNIIVEELMKEAMEEMEEINEDIIESQVDEETDEVLDKEDNDAGVISLDRINLDNKNIVSSIGSQMYSEKEVIPVIAVISDSEPKPLELPLDFDERDEVMSNTRLATERSLKRKGRKYRGSIKFKSDSQ